MAIKGIRADTLGFNNPDSETEIDASGLLTVTQTYVTVAPNGGGAGTDNLDNIAISTGATFNVLLILKANSGSTITMRHNAGGTGNLYTLSGLDTTLTATAPSIFYYDQATGNAYQITYNKASGSTTLNDLSDVTITPPYIESTLLAYDTGTAKWVNSDVDANSVKYSASTSVRDGGVLSVNGGDNTKFDITSSILQFADNYTDPTTPTLTVATVGAQTAVAPTYLATNDITYIGYKLDNTVPGGYTATGISATINGASSTLYLIEKPDVQFTQEELREITELGIVVHRDNLTVQRVVNEGTYLGSEGLILYDLISSIGVFNIAGNAYTYNGANLKLDKSAGQTHRVGVNLDGTADGRKRPNIIDDSSVTQVPFIYRYQDGVGGFNEGSVSTITDIDPNQYDNGSGTLQAVNNNKWTVQTIYWYTTGNTRIQYGQAQYDTKEQAKSAISTRAYVEDENLTTNASLRAWLIVQKGATDLSDSAQAEFVTAGKFGFGGGGSGGDTLGSLSTTNGNTVRADGTVWDVVANNYSASTAPDANDDETANYAVGSIWVDTTNNNVYQAVDVTTSNAIWLLLNRNVATRTVTTTDTVTVNDRYILADTTSGEFTLTLPTASSASGLTFDIYLKDASGGSLTIDGNGSETIDNELTQELTTAGDSATLFSTGTEYIIL